MLILSIRQTDCIRVQQTVGQRSNRIEIIIGSTYWYVICNWVKFPFLLTAAPFCCTDWGVSNMLPTVTFSECYIIYRVSYEEISIFCEVIVSVMICTCVLFGTVWKMDLFDCTGAKLFIKCNYVLFLISESIVQVTKLVQFTQYNTFLKIPPSTATYFATRVRTWRVAGLSASWLSLFWR